MIKKIILILFIVLFFGLFYSLGRQIYDSLQSGNRLEREMGDLVKLQEKNKQLRKQLETAGSLGSIEALARNKLNMARSGESVVIIPQKEIDKILGVREEVKERVLPYWQGWLRLFFK